MPDEGRRVLNLMHELKPIEGRDRSAGISVDDLDMAEVLERKGAGVLGPDSRLRRVFRSVVAAALKVANFKSGTPQMVDAPYAVLVLCCRRGGELDIVEVVAVEAVLASEARNAFKKVMSREMMAPVRSMAAVLSCLTYEDATGVLADARADDRVEFWGGKISNEGHGHVARHRPQLKLYINMTWRCFQ
ncbi:hypothetical protein ACLOJK_001383 [Asimina triloba]